MRRMLQPWEISMLTRLSREYVNATGEVQDEGCPPPYDGELSEVDRRAIAAGLMASLDRISA